ncbi:hypothetical protein DBV05_g320 [Lasiodiplodia theobromae]|nr:hypothetical protein DBV05_g320 [Lasiodiplodia theobromae]
MKLKNFSEGLEGLEIDVLAKFQLAKLLTGAGRFYHESGNLLDAIPLFEKAQRFGEYVSGNLTEEMLKASNVSSDDVEEVMAEIHYNIGSVATETNKPKDATHHFTIFNEMMAKDDHVRNKRRGYAISWNELGVANMMNMKLESAEKCFLRSIEIMEMDASAKESKSLPTVNLGLSYWLQGGRLEEADAVLMAGLQDREAVYGVNDRESFITGRFLHAIGNVKADLAELQADDSLLEESRTYHQRALNHYGDTIGKNHHRTADACVKVADHCMRLGLLDEAESNLEQALKVFNSSDAFLPERARATFKKSRVLELRGYMDEAAPGRGAGFELLQNLTDLKEKTAADVVDSDFDKVICFWSR